MEGRRLPDFLVIGAPKAGTTALHRALAGHPQLLMATPKEPKFFLSDGRRPRPQAGPGDAHSVREWIWRREAYEALFRGPPELLRGESTPFYLVNRLAHGRILESIPRAKLIAVLRDPIDRAHSNWAHLWCDGLEPEGDFLTACDLEERRVAAGWAPFWHYLRLGRYGEQLRDLLSLFPAEQVHLLRYRELVDEPAVTLDRICRFLGVEEGLISTVSPENVRGFVPDSARTRVLARSIRAGARAGAWFPPQLWRAASVPLVRALQAGGRARPGVAVEARRLLVERVADDVRLLESVTGRSFSDWLGDQGRGAFATRGKADGAEGPGPGEPGSTGPGGDGQPPGSRSDGVTDGGPLPKAARAG